MTIELDYAFGTKVNIIGLQVSGTVEIIQISVEGTEYKIAYWHNGDRKFAWLRRNELETIK